MSKILLVTVGGSHQPIITAIKELKPDRVVYFCSDGPKGSKFQVIGEGTPCEVRSGTKVIERLPNISKQVGLDKSFQQDRDLVLIQEPDDLSECYFQATSCIQKIQQEFPNAQIMADYTGGTKSMSVGLSMAAIDYQITLYVTTALRTNIIKVDRGELTGQATVAPIIAQRTIEQFLPIFLQQYNYPAANAQLKRLLSSMTLSSEIRRKIQTLYTCCSGLDAWDRFEHIEALSLLETQMKNPAIKEIVLFLKRVISSRGQIDTYDTENGMKGHGYEIVQDLILNAQRRATQERYDDAVGRLYRALELLAQIRLWTTYSIKTGDVDIEKLPETLRNKYESKRSKDKKTIQIASHSSCELLSELPNDPIGKLYTNEKNKIIQALSIRNNSLFAHGFKPINESDYEKVNRVFISFIQTAIESVIEPKLKSHPPQFPTVLDI